MTAPTRSPAGASSRRVLDLSESLAERARAMRSQGRKRLALVAGLIVMVLVLLWLVLLSPVFAVHEVQVSGSDPRVTKIATAAAQPQRGRPVLRVDTGALESRIEADPRVADATVRRSVPRGLAIEVVGRIPVLGLKKSKGQVDLVDMTGTRIETVAKAPAGVPTLTGGSAVGDRSAVALALSAVNALPEKLRAKVGAFRVDDTGSAGFTLGSTEVVWGGADQAALKARLVAILLEQDPERIDVSSPSTPVTT